MAPRPEPLLSEQAAFAKHLFVQGYPLWTPDPILLPQGLQRVGLRIGDVGTVDERGRFDVFFNILDCPPGTTEPPIFPPIGENDVRCSTEDISHREVISSPDTSWEVESPVEVELIPGVIRKTTQYSATLSNDGAHVILPRGAQSFELGFQHRQLFENHAREYGADWLERFRDRLGWPRSNSLYLLTGFYKTCSWSIASFGMKSAANTNPVGVYCTLAEVDERIIRDDSVWQPAGRFKRKIGPAPDRQGQNNQTIFIRGIMITPNPNLLGSAQHNRQAGLLGVLSGSTRSLLSTLMGSSAGATETEGNVVIQHVPQITQASHPSEIINQYLFIKEPHARIAVTHDSRWIAMVKEGRSWTLANLEDHLKTLIQDCYHIVTHNGTVYLRDKESIGFNADQSNLRSDLASYISTPNVISAKPLRSADNRPSTSIYNVQCSPPLHRETYVEEQVFGESHSPCPLPFHSTASEATEPISPTTPNISAPLSPASGRQSSYAYSSWLHSLFAAMESSSIDTDSSTSSESSIVSESDSEENEDSNLHTDTIINAFHSSRTGERPAANENASQPVISQALGEIHEFLRFNQNWTERDMLEFNRSLIDEKEVVCQWVEDGTLCNERVKAKELKLHLDRKHGITSDMQLYQCQWHACYSPTLKGSSLERHVKELHFAVKWACPYCANVFTREPTLLSHIERSHEHANP